MEKAARVHAIVARYHERGNHRRSLPMIYRTYVYTIYPISRRTMHYYLKLIREGETPPKEGSTRSLTLGIAVAMLGTPNLGQNNTEQGQ